MPSQDETKHALLARIASCIGVPISDFTAEPERYGSAPSAEEIIALVEAFQRVPCPNAREQCVSFVEAMGIAIENYAPSPPPK